MSTSKTPTDIIQEGEKNPRGIPKALFIVRPLRRFSGLLLSTPRFRLPSRSRSCIIVDCRPDFQNDVEEYLSGSNAAIEKVLGAFQDALACVSCPVQVRYARLTFLALPRSLSPSSFHSLSNPSGPLTHS